MGFIEQLKAVENTEKIVPAIAFSIVATVLMLVFCMSVLANDYRIIKNNIKNLKKMLKQNGFVISRKIGKFTYWLNAVQPFILYVDDKNKKWFMASLFFPEESEIYNFDNFGSNEFFNVVSPPKRKESHGLSLTALFLGIIDMLEGVLSDEFYKILRYKSGIVMSYGLKIKSNDKMLEFDFLEVGRRFIKKQKESKQIKINGVKIFKEKSANNTAKTGIDRKSKFYKKSAKLINKMEKAFTDITVYNQAKNF